ncbi:hypothetical protein [Finch poxvirus]|uniref:Uncharacterized protein n=2 Tax=unclassified Avipoxvirus TaxID=336487 RepID=A0AAT9UQ04_9POXV|nr:hypothetical protein [Finch poxvirus]UOX38958.1 hypothetical protein [Finch poxvirus]
MTFSKVKYNEMYKSNKIIVTDSDINLRKSKLIEVRKRINSTKSEINKYGLLNT